MIFIKSKLQKWSMWFAQITCLVSGLPKVQAASMWGDLGSVWVPGVNWR